MFFEWDDAKSQQNQLERGLSVVYSDRGDVRRIISARLTNKKERKLWQSFVEHWSKSAE
jgi:uncharacterized DUF497 family protein